MTFQKGQLSGVFKTCNTLARLVQHITQLATHRFVAVPAITPDLYEKCGEIRYDVFAKEKHWEKANLMGVELNGSDNYSEAILVKDRQSQDYVGTIRLVYGQHQGQDKELPMEELFSQDSDVRRLIQSYRDQGIPICEVSRLAVLRGVRNQGKVRGLSAASTALYAAKIALEKKRGIKTAFAIVEPGLLKCFTRLNLPIKQIGEGVEHHGKRVPIMMDVDALERKIPFVFRFIYKAIRNDLEKVFATQNVQPLRPLPEAWNGSPGNVLSLRERFDVLSFLRRGIENPETVTQGVLQRARVRAQGHQDDVPKSGPMPLL